MLRFDSVVVLHPVPVDGGVGGMEVCNYLTSNYWGGSWAGVGDGRWGFEVDIEARGRA